MQFYPADYVADTRHLTPAQHGAYLLLICEYWVKGSLPQDDRTLARIVGMTPKEWLCAKNVVQGFFHDGWQHKRIDVELAKAKDKHERRQEAGKRGGFASANSKQNSSIATSNAQASSSEPEPEPERKISSLRSESARKRGARLPEDWNASAEDWTAALAKLGEAGAIEEACKFRDYWKAQPGQRGTKLDWDATFRNWIRNAKGLANGHGTSTVRTYPASGPAPTRDTAVIAGMGRALERRRAARAADDAGRQDVREGGCAGAASGPDADRAAEAGDPEPSGQLAFLPVGHARA